MSDIILKKRAKHNRVRNGQLLATAKHGDTELLLFKDKDATHVDKLLGQTMFLVTLPKGSFEQIAKKQK